MQLLFWFHLWAKFWMTQMQGSNYVFLPWLPPLIFRCLWHSSTYEFSHHLKHWLFWFLSDVFISVGGVLPPFTQGSCFPLFQALFFFFPQMQHQNSFFLTSLKPTPHSSVPSAIVVVQTAFMTMNDLCVFGFCKPLDHPACCCPWLVLFYFHLMWFNSMLWAATFLPYSVLCTSSSNSKNEGDITQREQFVLSRKP